jgi:hypothetical protein
VANYIEQTGSFTAHEADGTEYTIYILTEVVESETHGGSARADAISSLQTETGEPVNRISKGHYELVNSRVKLTSDDPDAR